MNDKLRKYLQNHWLWLGVGAILLGAGILMVPHAKIEGGYNYFVALPMCLFLIGGVWLLYKSAKALIMSLLTGEASFSPALKPKEYKEKPNTIVIKAERQENEIVPLDIEFCYIESPIGYRHKLENTGEYFYLNTRDINSGELKPLILPDTIYLDPTKYVIPLTMPANAKYWKPIPNAWEKVSTFALIGIIMIEFIAGVVWG